MPSPLARMDRNALRMALVSYPLLLGVDVLVLQAVLPGRWLAQAIHAALGVAGVVWLIVAYRARPSEE